MTMNKDSPEVVKFMRLFAKLKEWSDDDSSSCHHHGRHRGGDCSVSPEAYAMPLGDAAMLDVKFSKSDEPTCLGYVMPLSELPSLLKVQEVS